MVPKTCVAAIAALFLAVAPSAGAVAPQASCQGSITSVLATAGLLRGGAIGDDVHSAGQPAFAEFQQLLAHQQPSSEGCGATP